jgi:hypothetical protein
MAGQRLQILAMAVCDRPAAAATCRKLAPAATAARMFSSRRAVQSRALLAALVTGERSVTVAGRPAGVVVDEATEALLGHSEVDGALAVLADALGVGVRGGLGHGFTVNQVSTVVNKVSA